MKTGVVFCYLLAGIVLCIGTASGTVVSLSDADKSLIVKTHNDIRSDVSPTAANMIKLVSQYTHTYIHMHTHTTTPSHTHTHTHTCRSGAMCLPILHIHMLKSAHMLTATKLKETKQVLLLSLQSVKTS